MRSKHRRFVVAVLLGVLTIVGWANKQEDRYEDFGEFFKYYYQKPQSDKVPDMLQQLLESEQLIGEKYWGSHYQNVTAYFFGRVAQSEPELVENYLSMFENGTHRQRLFLLKILRFCGDHKVREFFTDKLKEGRFINEERQISLVLKEGIPIKFTPFTEAVSEAGDLDFLWTEFMVTGSKEAVIKIIESLDQDSSSSESFLLACAADWSLNNNCREHKKVLEICEEELLRVNDPIKRILEAVLDEAKIFDVLKKTERCENEGKASEQTMKPKGQKEDKVTGAKAWALGCSAVLSERNHYRHDLLGYSLSPTKEQVEKAKELLGGWWGINSRKDLFDTLYSLYMGGHRKRFNQTGIYVSRLSEEEYMEVVEQYKGDEETLQEIRIAREYYKKLGRKSIFGWDYGRYISLCRWGYMIGYINEDEAWRNIMAVARMLQKRFDSWEDLGRNYLIGRRFWSYKYTEEDGYLYEDAFQRLVDMPSSPWNRYPWDMDLTATETVGGSDGGGGGKKR